MNQQEPKFLPLESPGPLTFWPDAQRRVLILPMRDSAQFLALGVLGEQETPVFVARGNLWEHLGDFLARMEQEGARVEFPMQLSPHLDALWKEYAFSDDFESKNSEPPPPPPPGFQDNSSASPLPS